MLTHSNFVFSRPAPFCDFTQPRIMFISDVSGQPVGLIFKFRAVQEDGTDTLSRNVCKRFPSYAA